MKRFIVLRLSTTCRLDPARTNKRKILKTDYPVRVELQSISRFSNQISGNSSLNTTSSCGVLDPARNKYPGGHHETNQPRF